MNTEGNEINNSDKLKLSIKALAKLKGVGVATASLILAIYTKVIPFMADESMLAISPGLSLKYDMKTYINYVAKLVEKCNVLNMCRNDEKTDEAVEAVEHFMVTPFVLAECLWIDHMIKRLGDSKNKNINTKHKKGKKRKADDDISDFKPAKKRRL
eukprot:UN11665